LRAAERLELLIIAAKPAMPFDEDANLDTLSIAACFTHAGELGRVFLVGRRSLRAVSLSSEERGAVAGGAGEMAFLFPFEEWRRDIRVAGRGWRKLLS
jgi:hypothetical protein